MVVEQCIRLHNNPNPRPAAPVTRRRQTSSCATQRSGALEGAIKLILLEQHAANVPIMEQIDLIAK